MIDFLKKKCLLNPKSHYKRVYCNRIKNSFLFNLSYIYVQVIWNVTLFTTNTSGLNLQGSKTLKCKSKPYLSSARNTSNISSFI